METKFSSRARASRAVLMSFAEYEAVTALREEARRTAALERLRGAKARASARNQDLTDEQATELADRFVREEYRP